MKIIEIKHTNLFITRILFNNKQMTLLEYIDNINQRYQLGNATEHTFRGDLQQLFGNS